MKVTWTDDSGGEHEAPMPVSESAFWERILKQAPYLLPLNEVRLRGVPVYFLANGIDRRIFKRLSRPPRLIVLGADEPGNSQKPSDIATSTKMRKFISLMDVILVQAAKQEARIYRLAATAALAGANVLIIECADYHEADWYDAVMAAKRLNTKVILHTVKASGRG